MSLGQFKVMSAIEHCRTAAFGGHVARCEKCANTQIAYNHVVFMLPAPIARQLLDQIVLDMPIGRPHRRDGATLFQTWPLPWRTWCLILGPTAG